MFTIVYIKQLLLLIKLFNQYEQRKEHHMRCLCNCVTKIPGATPSSEQSGRGPPYYLSFYCRVTCMKHEEKEFFAMSIRLHIFQASYFKNKFNTLILLDSRSYKVNF